MKFMTNGKVAKKVRRPEAVKQMLSNGFIEISYEEYLRKNGKFVEKKTQIEDEDE